MAVIYRLLAHLSGLCKASTHPYYFTLGSALTPVQVWSAPCHTKVLKQSKNRRYTWKKSRKKKGRGVLIRVRVLITSNTVLCIETVKASCFCRIRSHMSLSLNKNILLLEIGTNVLHELSYKASCMNFLALTHRDSSTFKIMLLG